MGPQGTDRDLVHLREDRPRHVGFDHPCTARNDESLYRKNCYRAPLPRRLMTAVPTRTALAVRQLRLSAQHASLAEDDLLPQTYWGYMLGAEAAKLPDGCCCRLRRDSGQGFRVGMRLMAWVMFAPGRSFIVHGP